MKLIFWLNAVKPHLVPDELLDAVKADIDRRFSQPVFEELDRRQTLFRIDLGGPMMGDAQWVGVDLEGTDFQVPIRDIEVLYLELLQAPARQSLGKTYYKLRGWLHCVVFTAAQRKTVLAAWGSRLQEYHDKAELEVAEHRRRVAVINRHPNIRLSVPAEPPAAVKKDFN